MARSTRQGRAVRPLVWWSSRIWQPLARRPNPATLGQAAESTNPWPGSQIQQPLSKQPDPADPCWLYRGWLTLILAPLGQIKLGQPNLTAPAINGHTSTLRPNQVGGALLLSSLGQILSRWHISAAIWPEVSIG